MATSSSLPAAATYSRSQPSSVVPAVEAGGDEDAAEMAEAASADGAAVDAPPSNVNPEDTNVWPDENAEAAFMAEARGRGESPVATPRSDEDDDERGAKKLPPLSELVERIPAETRELMDELFRAKFVAVRKVKKSALKSNS